MAQTIAEPGVHGPVEVTVVTPDGRLREVELMVTNGLEDPDVGYLVVSGRDVTDRDDEAGALRRPRAASPLTRRSAGSSHRTGRLASGAVRSGPSRRRGPAPPGKPRFRSGSHPQRSPGAGVSPAQEPPCAS